MKKTIFLIITIAALLFAAKSFARTTTKNLMFGGITLGTGIAMMMHTECTQAAAYMWDMEQSDRINNFKCIEIFKGFKDHKGLAIYKKLDALAKSSYSDLKKALLLEQSNAGGSSEPPEGCDAHHIVPQKEGRSWAKELADKSRMILSKCNIGINSSNNGVFLPNGRSTTPVCEGQHHPSLHTREYYSEVHSRLDTAYRNGTCDDVRNALRDIKSDLIGGKL